MAFEVMWSPAAEKRLAELWLKSETRAEIRAAANRLDESLRRAPLTLGESRSEDERIAFDGPLGCSYRVDPDLQLVYVLSIWKSSRRNR